ncbi:MAG: hypothetical protein IPP40_01285 [bacterium]|nr:hypothetical protein [bacterium]
MPKIDTQLLQILVCPLSKSTLVEYNDTLVSTDKVMRRSYSIVEGIPDLMIEHSRELSVGEWDQVMQAVGRT